MLNAKWDVNHRVSLKSHQRETFNIQHLAFNIQH